MLGFGRSLGMLQNNIELDLKTKLIEVGLSQTEVAEKVGVSLAYVNRITKGHEQIVNKTFVKIMDELSYNVELTYKTYKKKMMPEHGHGKEDSQ